MRFWLVLFSASCIGFGWQTANAQKTPTPAGAQKAQVVNDGSMVYKAANFDAPVITYLQAGKVYFVSIRKFSEAFYKIKLANGSFGYIADTDVRVARNRSAEARRRSNPKQHEPAARAKKKRAFVSTRYMGLSLLNVAFKEDTVGRVETDNLLFYGMKISGPNLMTEGENPTEINLMFHSGAPKYYESLTGNSADGYIFLIDGLFITPFDEAYNRAFYFGFGPLFRYSNISVKLDGVDLSMQDMRLGAAFDLGMGVRVGGMAIRAEAKYYWEREKYLAFGAAFQF